MLRPTARAALLSLSLSMSLAPRLAGADQLQCNSQAVAERAVAILEPGTLVIDFCSLCEGKAQVVRVVSARAVQDCEFEVELTGQVVAETEQTWKETYDQTGARYRPLQKPYSNRVDLAYVYVETAANDFRWLGGELRQDATVNVRSIRLPAAFYESLGAHPISSKLEQRDRLPAPDPEQVKRAWYHHYQGQGRAPLLVEAKPCLEVDNKKGSETRFECLRPVEGPVPNKTTVHLWTAWLIPQGDKHEDLMVQFLHGDTVRTTRDVKLEGQSFRTRHYTGASLNKPGEWTIVLRRGEEELHRERVLVQ